MTNMNPVPAPYATNDNPTYVIPPKKKFPLGWAVTVFVALLLGLFAGIGSSGTKATVAAPAPAPVTVTATATVTQAAPAPAPVTVTANTAEASGNVAMMKLAWKNMSSTDRASIRDSWAEYKDNPTMAKIFVNTFQSTMNDGGFNFTSTEVIEFLNWTLSN